MRPLHLLTLLTPISASSLPLVIWHGLGDTYDSSGIASVAALYNDVHSNTTFVHSISLDADPSSDRTASFFGLIDTQIATVCAQLASIPELAAGFNALGFSQGGQFLRGYIERCNAPPVSTLLTFGSQHMGISDFLGACKPTDWVCRSASSLLRSSKWADFVQRKVVPAQYFRDPEKMDEYLQYSAFLADINNEREGKNQTYRQNLGALRRFVMVVFRDDRTVVPRETGWFAEVNATSGEVRGVREMGLYKEDWIGLRALDERGGLEFVEVEGEHMQFSDETLRGLFEKYMGPDEEEEEEEEEGGEELVWRPGEL